ncbi:MAG: hypothetical protein FD149_2229 [Rhodospirillaceae bacterium]|nr:MAG: hypothetical protein FD149_2229 [Rhodospirillaceae bacterium]
MTALTELIPLREALLLARANGIRSVTHCEKRIEYKSDDEMAAALAALEREIAVGQDRVRRVYITTSKGV